MTDTEYYEKQVKYIVGTYKYFENPDKYNEKKPQGRPAKSAKEDKKK